MKTYVAKPNDIEKKWFVVDAEDVVLGRLAAVVASRLRGKHKPTFTPFMDCGDNIVVINADKVRMTGKKASKDKYYWHTGYPGSVKDRTRAQILAGDHPERVIELAVKRMLPSGALGRTMFKNLRVYAGTEHGHEAQKPEVLDVASMNSKNKR